MVFDEADSNLNLDAVIVTSSKVFTFVVSTCPNVIEVKKIFHMYIFFDKQIYKLILD
jgi:hypothetical protein